MPAAFGGLAGHVHISLFIMIRHSKCMYYITANATPPDALLTWKTFYLVLEIIVNCRTLVLRDALLLSVHLRNLSAGGSFIRLLVVSDFDKPREPQTDALLTRGVNTLLAAGLVPRAEGQIRGLDLPDVLWLEPDVRLMLPTG